MVVEAEVSIPGLPLLAPHLEAVVDLEVVLDGQVAQEVQQLRQAKEIMVVLQLVQVLVFTLQQVVVALEP